MTHAHDTHVLIDDRGIAVFTGGRQAMEDYATSIRANGGECEVQKIDDLRPDWHWETLNWGD